MDFIEGRRGDVTGVCWQLFTVMLLSWERTICVLLLAV